MLRTELCYQISRRLMKPGGGVSSDADDYADWRSAEMLRSWAHFSDADVTGRDVLDFGCGEGPLALHLARTAAPRSIVGVDVDPVAIERANAALLQSGAGRLVRFALGETSALPLADDAVDTILAFDCLEHIMDLPAILAEWRRVLRRGGKVLIDWCPFKGPYGPHMTGLVPIPWAHVLFGERAMFETAARIYDDPAYRVDHWDTDETGAKRPNKWRQWRSFSEQGYVNQLALPAFVRMARASGFAIERQESVGFGRSGLKAALGKTLVKLPLVSEHFTSFCLIELRKT